MQQKVSQLMPVLRKNMEIAELKTACCQTRTYEELQAEMDGPEANGLDFAGFQRAVCSQAVKLMQ